MAGLFTMRVTENERFELALFATDQGFGSVAEAIKHVVRSRLACFQKRTDVPTSRLLRRITIERVAVDRWKVLRERDETGETFYATDLLDAFDYVSAAYWPNGEPR